MGTAYEFETFILEKSWSLCCSKRSHIDFLGIEIHKLSYEEEKPDSYLLSRQKRSMYTPYTRELSKYQKGIEQ